MMPFYRLFWYSGCTQQGLDLITIELKKTHPDCSIDVTPSSRLQIEPGLPRWYDPYIKAPDCMHPESVVHDIRLRHWLTVTRCVKKHCPEAVLVAKEGDEI